MFFLTFRFFPKKGEFSSTTVTAMKKLDKNLSFSQSVEEPYVQLKINIHFFNMLEEFFPSSARKIIQSELRKVTVMESGFISSESALLRDGFYMIGMVKISVTHYTDYYFSGDNLNGMIRAILIAKRLGGKKLETYQSPPRFYSGDEMITKEIKSLRKALEEAKKQIANLEHSEAQSLAEKTIEISKPKAPKWQFWL